MPGLLIGEAEGGFGGTWEDALIVFRLAGFNALAIPVVESILAAFVSQRTTGRGTVAGRTTGIIEDGRFAGEIDGICQGQGADYLVAPHPEGGSIVLALEGHDLAELRNVAGEMRQSLSLVDVPVTITKGDIFVLGALARAAQIAGALDAALGKSVDYANERKQFGKNLAQFQAVQQNLATFACEAAAANCAAMGAAQALDRNADSVFEVAAAKLRANRAVGAGTALAHQVHGAIGFTEEYPLHPLTRRLWAWRSEFGNDSRWSELLGARITARGANNFWADLTA